ncbi:MAG: hypothetical protein LBR74_00160 [Eubacterium sp.]|jgi:sodium-dependent dicarboxylate transporter 2/3/5|nr:hypothetical protein [Eubacterium sp.]
MFEILIEGKIKLDMNTRVEKTHRFDTKYYIKVIIGLFFMFGFGLLPPVHGLTVVGMKIIGIFFSLLFLWSAVGIVWPSILGIIAFGMSGYAPMTQVIASGLGSPVVWQLLMIMIISGAITSSGLGEYIARKIMSSEFTRGKPVTFIFLFLWSLFLVGVLSNAFAPLFLGWSIIYSIADMAGYKKRDKTITILLVFVTMICGLGEFVIPFKGWQLALVESFNNITGITMSYTLFMAVAFIIGTLIALIFAISIKYVFKADLSKLNSFDPSVLQDFKQKKLTYRQKSYFFSFIFIVCATLLTTVLPDTWLLQRILSSLTGNGIFALAVVLLCLIRVDGSPLLDFGEVAKSGIKWEVVFICASIIPLASALTSKETGIIELITRTVSPFFEGKSAAFVLALLIFLITAATNIGSNTGVALLFIPIAVPLAIAANLSLQVVGIAVIYSACMGFILPGASAISAVGYTNDWIAPKDMIRYASYGVLCYVVVSMPVYLILNIMLPN